MENTGGIVDINEAKAMMNVSRQTVYKMIEQGELTPLPKPPALGKRAKVLFHRSDVEKFAVRPLETSAK